MSSSMLDFKKAVKVLARIRKRFTQIIPGTKGFNYTNSGKTEVDFFEQRRCDRDI